MPIHIHELEATARQWAGVLSVRPRAAALKASCPVVSSGRFTSQSANESIDMLRGMPACARDRSIVHSDKRRLGSGSLCFHQQLVEQLETEINLFFADMQRRCKRDDIFVVAA